MSIATTVAKLQAVNRSIAQVRTAPDRYPAAINAADCPCVLTVPAEGDSSQQTLGELKRRIGQYRLMCFVRPIAAGASPDEGMQEAITVLQAMLDKWLPSDTIVQDAGGRQITVQKDSITDTGITTMLFAGTLYHYCEIRLTVSEKWT